jgi:hypothetical protein
VDEIGKALAQEHTRLGMQRLDEAILRLRKQQDASEVIEILLKAYNDFQMAEAFQSGNHHQANIL